MISPTRCERVQVILGWLAKHLLIASVVVYAVLVGFILYYLDRPLLYVLLSTSLPLLYAAWTSDKERQHLKELEGNSIRSCDSCRTRCAPGRVGQQSGRLSPRMGMMVTSP